MISRRWPHSVEGELGLSDPFVDPGVGEFGLENRVYAAGDCFLEVLTPIKADSAGARLPRSPRRCRRRLHGHLPVRRACRTPRQRAADLGIRIVWRADLEDISGTHLHPSDIGAAIVSLDWADPPESWRWAGPRVARWCACRRQRGCHRGDVSPRSTRARLSARWAEVLGPGARLADTTVHLDDAGQELSFVQAADAQHEGITGCDLTLPTGTSERVTDIGGVRFTVARLVESHDG